MALSNPDINGLRYSFSSLTAQFMPQDPTTGVPGTPIGTLGFESISYSAKVEPGIVYGTSPQPIGRTRGQLKLEGSVSLFKEDAENLIAQLAAKGAATGKGFMLVPFLLEVSYAEAPNLPVTDQLISCRITSVEDDASGTDALKVKLSLSIMDILYNKLSPV